MSGTLKLHALGAWLSLLFLCSCATAPYPPAISPASTPPALPAEVSFTNVNGRAGHGGHLFLTLHLGDGEKLLFMVDTGAQGTILDRSLESKIGKRVRRAEVFFPYYERREPARLYGAPRLYLGDTQLLMGKWIMTDDLSAMTDGVPIIRGILGIDCLRHYCVQLDFTAGKMRFLQPDDTRNESLGKAFPLTFSSGQMLVGENFFGLTNATSLIDTGDPHDGAGPSNTLHRAVEQQMAVWTNRVRMANTNHLSRAHFQTALFGGENYSDLLVHVHFQNTIGLRFLARHLVTLNFPKRTMYLKLTSTGPLADLSSKMLSSMAALEFTCDAGNPYTHILAMYCSLTLCLFNHQSHPPSIIACAPAISRPASIESLFST